MSEPKRLFFAIELPADVREQIVAWRAAHFPGEAGRPVAADNLHLTLAFLGEVSADKQKALAALAGRIRQPGFTLTLLLVVSGERICALRLLIYARSHPLHAVTALDACQIRKKRNAVYSATPARHAGSAL